MNAAIPPNQRTAPAETRRRFIKSSSMLVMGTTVGSGFALGATPHTYGSSQLRVGLIGCGTRGRAAVSDLLATEGPIELVAVADVFEHRIKACLRGLSRQSRQVTVPADRQFTGLTAYQQLLQTDCHIVVLATPPAFRPLHLDAVIDAGKNAFVETPVAVDAPGVRQVLHAAHRAKQRDLAIAVGLQRRHEDRYRQTIGRLQEGGIGDIILSRAYWNGSGIAPASRISHDTELEYQLRNWQFFTWLSGDPIVEQHIHNLDVINWLKNDYPVSAQGMGGRDVRRGPEFGQIYDHHFVEFTYADGSKLLSQCRQTPGCWNSVSEHVHGTQGTADISGGRLKGKDGETLWQYGRGGGQGWHAEQLDFVAALRRGDFPNEAYYGAMSTMTAILGRTATYSGQLVTMAATIADDTCLSHPSRLTRLDDTPSTLPNARGDYPVLHPDPLKGLV